MTLAMFPERYSLKIFEDSLKSAIRLYGIYLATGCHHQILNQALNILIHLGNFTLEDVIHGYEIKIQDYVTKHGYRPFAITD